MAPHRGEEELGLQCSKVFTERNLKKNMDREDILINITPPNILKEFLVLQNIYTSDNPDSNFELYDTRIN